MSKNLIVYYSWSGNTKALAEAIQAEVGGDLVELLPEKPYSDNYALVVTKAKIEQLSKSRPKLKTKIVNFADYDTIYLGYPNWWGSLPLLIATFAESYDFSGKKIVPFFTHGGGGIQNLEKDLRKLLPQAEIAKPLVVQGNTVQATKKNLQPWLAAI